MIIIISNLHTEKKKGGFHDHLCSFFEKVNGLRVVTVKKKQAEMSLHPNCDQHCTTMP